MGAVQNLPSVLVAAVKFALNCIIMKLKMSTIYIAAMIVCLFIPFLSNAQPPIFTEDVEDLPIDGSLSLLIAAGVGYGIKKVKTSKHTTNLVENI